MTHEIVRAKHAGFCHGVRRAVERALALAERGVPCVTLGALIHNASVTELLRERGVGRVEAPEDAPPGATVLIRSHGAAPETYEILKARGNPVEDCTCPHVERIHRLLSGRRDKLVILVGDAAHPEVRGHRARCGECVVASVPEDVPETDRPAVIVAQTTAEKENWEKCVFAAKKRCTNLEILDTICAATCQRQAEALEIARHCDATVVVGDPQSSNTSHLRDLCRSVCANVFLVERAAQLPDLTAYRRVGLTAGASAPGWRIEEVYTKMSDEMIRDSQAAPEAAEPQQTPAEEPAASAPEPVAAEAAAAPEPAAEPVKPAADSESFEALLEQSLKSLNTGDKVTGVITNISPTELYVELGTKHAGYIPVSELSDDPEYKVEDHIKVGDEIEVYVLRVNDVEGTAMLSKRRLDTVKSWEDVENASGENVVMEGIVTEENKGGVVVSVKGVRVFVPASQTGLPKDTPMSELLKRKVKLKITEFNRARRRVVGSIRIAQQEEKRARSESVWNEIEPGKRYQGTVKSLTSYGAFVDIGGVDGMVHVSELSWSRIRQPADMVKVGDPLEVYVISVDREKRKISLGHKNKNENPWVKFTEKFKKGDTAHVRIASLMPFGAFAEILPGVDGLIHISQITDRRIGKPGDVLSVGEEVDVMVTDIDYERQKISLSIRALAEEPPLSEEDAFGEDEIVASSGE